MIISDYASIMQSLYFITVLFFLEYYYFLFTRIDRNHINGKPLTDFSNNNKVNRCVKDNFSNRILNSY